MACGLVDRSDRSFSKSKFKQLIPYKLLIYKIRLGYFLGVIANLGRSMSVFSKKILIGAAILTTTVVGASVYAWTALPGWAKGWVAQYGESIGYEISFEDLNLSLFQLKAEVSKLKILEAQSKAPLLTINKTLVDLNFLGHLSKNIDVADVKIDEPVLHLMRGRDQWNWQEFISAVMKKADENPKKVSSKPFQFLVEKFELKDASVHIQDVKKTFKYEFNDLNLQLKNLTNLDTKAQLLGIRSGFGIQMGELSFPDPKTKNKIPLGDVSVAGNIDLDDKKNLLLDLVMHIDQGKIVAKASMDLSLGNVMGDLDLTHLSLIPAIAMLPTTTPLLSKSGALSGKLKILASKQSIKVSGDFDISKLSIFEPDNKSELLAWSHADIKGFEFSKADQGQRLMMNELVVAAPRGKLTIYEDRTTNFRKLFVQSDAKTSDQAKREPISTKEIDAPKKDTSPPKSIELPTGDLFQKNIQQHIQLASAKSKKSKDTSLNTPKQTEKEKPFDLEIRSIALKGASIDFTDFSIKPKFQTQINDFHGSVLGLSNQPNRYASMAFDGKVDQSGLVKLRGRVAFSDPRRNNDLTLAFKRIPLKSINPYAKTFAGYEIKDGMISLILDYKVKEAELKGDNRIVINQIQLGDEVSNYQGKSLPLKLAIALLEDGDGVIDLNVPVSGNIDQPEFSTGHVVWQAITTVITNIASAPFRAIGNLLGVDHFNGIFFEPGEGTLSLAQRDKVEHLASALKKRAKAKLILRGVYDPEEDAVNLAHAHIDRGIFKAAGFNLASDEPLPKLSIEDDRIQKAISELYLQKAGRLKSLQRQIFGPGGLERAKSLREEMIAAENVTEHQLQLLAKHRAALIKRAILDINPALNDRVEVGEVKAGRATTDGISLEVEFASI